MSELARVTAQYLAVLLERDGMSASIPAMRRELEAADAADAAALAVQIEDSTFVGDAPIKPGRDRGRKP